MSSYALLRSVNINEGRIWLSMFDLSVERRKKKAEIKTKVIHGLFANGIDLVKVDKVDFRLIFVVA